jgi:outer membrane protein assembly factor BamD (BamD/ComL family)
MLDQARGAVRDGQPARGLSILDAYASRFPHGAMAPEASIVRIEALVRAGDRAGAKRAGDAFLRANPSSPYAPRIESLVGSTNP